MVDSVRKYDRDANFVRGKVYECIRCLNPAIADITVNGILVGSREKHTFALYVYECVYHSAIYEL